DGLAGKVHASRVAGDLDLPAFPDLGELAARDDERGVLDRRAPVPDDEPRPLVDGRSCRLWCLSCTRRRIRCHDNHTRQNEAHTFRHNAPPHQLTKSPTRPFHTFMMNGSWISSP